MIATVNHLRHPYPTHPANPSKTSMLKDKLSCWFLAQTNLTVGVLAGFFQRAANIVRCANATYATVDQLWPSDSRCDVISAHTLLPWHHFFSFSCYLTAATFHCAVHPWVVKFCVTLEYCVELYDKVGGGDGVAVGLPTLLILIETDRGEALLGFSSSLTHISLVNRHTHIHT